MLVQVLHFYFYIKIIKNYLNIYSNLITTLSNDVHYQYYLYTLSNGNVDYIYLQCTI